MENECLECSNTELRIVKGLCVKCYLKKYLKTYRMNKENRKKQIGYLTKWKTKNDFSKYKYKYKCYKHDIDFDDMIIKQVGRCAICKGIMIKPCIDHNHKTDVVRGLLCPLCNTALGMLKEKKGNFERAIKYLFN